MNLKIQRITYYFPGHPPGRVSLHLFFALVSPSRPVRFLASASLGHGLWLWLLPFPFPFLGVGGTEIKHYLVDLLTFSCFNKLNQFQLHLIFLTWCIITNNIFQPCDLDLWLHNILGSSTFTRCGFGLWDHFSLWKHRLTYFPLSCQSLTLFHW